MSESNRPPLKPSFEVEFNDPNPTSAYFETGQANAHTTGIEPSDGQVVGVEAPKPHQASPPANRSKLSVEGKRTADGPSPREEKRRLMRDGYSESEAERLAYGRSK